MDLANDGLQVIAVEGLPIEIAMDAFHRYFFEDVGSGSSFHSTLALL